MNAQSGLNTYKQVDIGASVASASPHELVSMLMAGVLKRILDAKGAIQRNNVQAKGVAISKAISIIGELQGSLKDTETNAIAVELDRLYDYIVLCLTKANLESSLDKLDEVAALMMKVKEGWDGIGTHATEG